MGQANGVAGAVAATAKVSHVTCGRQSLRSLSPVPSEALLDATDAHGAARRQAEHRALRAGGSAAENPLETRVSLVPPTTRLCQITAGSKRCVPPLDFRRFAVKKPPKAKRKQNGQHAKQNTARDATTRHTTVDATRRRCGGRSRARAGGGARRDLARVAVQGRRAMHISRTASGGNCAAHRTRNGERAPWPTPIAMHTPHRRAQTAQPQVQLHPPNNTVMKPNAHQKRSRQPKSISLPLTQTLNA